MKNVLAIIIFLTQVLLSIECYGAEYRTIEDFTYGRFEVRMMSGSGDGTGGNGLIHLKRDKIIYGVQLLC